MKTLTWILTALFLSAGPVMGQIDPIPTCVAGAIGDFVWEDLDGDAVQDPGETGLEGIYVVLIEDDGDGVFEPASDDAILDYQATDSGGGYLFEDLAEGSYWVDVYDNSVPDGYALTTGNDPMLVDLGADEYYLDADFGYRPVDDSTCVTIRRPGDDREQVFDAYVLANKPTSNRGAGTRLFTGELYNAERRSLLAFDLSAIPSDAVIDSATLVLSFISGNTNVVRVHRATEAWDETTVTWDSFGDAFDPDTISYFVPDTSGERKVDLTDLVADWMSGSVENHGVLLEQNMGSVEKIRSSEADTVSARPRLEVCYSTPGDCVVTASSFTFTYIEAVDNGDGTTTLRFEVRNDNDCGLSYVAIGLPDGVVPVSPQDGDTWVGNRTYTVEFPAGVPFYSVKFETADPDGVKNGESDVFEVVLANEDAGYTVTIAAKACTITGEGTFDEDCGPEPKTAGLGDYVWHDRGYGDYESGGGKAVDGIQDADEPGIEGVLVGLYDDAGNLLATTQTDDTGYYEFLGLAAGTYRVKILDENFADGGVLDGWYATFDNEGGDDTRDSDGDMDTHDAWTTLSAGEFDDTIDFGFFYVCVYLEKTGPDSAVPGEEVTYHFRVENCGDIVLHGGVSVYDALIEPYGDHEIWWSVVWPGEVYEFDRTYTPDEDDCGGLVNTATAIGHPQRPDGQYLSNVEDESTWTVDVICWATIGDYVWYDTDQDGLQDDDEDPVPDVKVTLYTGAGDYVDEMYTDDTGHYLFTHLPPGDYYLWFEAPGGGYEFTFQDSGPDALDSDADRDSGITATTTLVYGEEDLTWDAGIFKPSLVRIAGLQALTVGDDVVVRWITAMESGTAGFYLERKTAPDSYDRVTPGLVLPIGFDGGEYEVVDPGAVSGGTYVYRLIELTTDGGELVYGPFTLTVDGPALTFDEWKQAVFTAGQLNDPAVSAPDADADGDGLTTEEEYAAGTDPLNAGSALRFRSIRRNVGGGVVLEWASVPGKTYRVLRAVSGGGGYALVGEHVAATGERTAFVDRTADFGAVFYKIEVEP